MKKYKNIIIIALAVIVTIALNLSLEINTGKIDGNWYTVLTTRLRNSFEFETFKTIVYFIASYFLFKKSFFQSQITKKRKIWKVVFAAFISIFTVIGISYKSQNNWDLIFYSKFQFAKACFAGVGYYVFYRALINFVFDRLVDKIKYRESTNKIINFVFEKRSLIIPLAIIFICWFPYIVAHSPGLINNDSKNQIRQFYGKNATGATDSAVLIDPNVKLTNHHPILHTLILGSCIKVGHTLGSDNLGVFIYTIMQATIFAFTLAYIINYMKKLKTPIFIRVIALVVFALLPVFPLYAMFITKDILFVCAMIFYTIKLYELFEKCKNKEKYGRRDILQIFALMLAVCLLRNNGFYNVLLSFPLFVFFDKVNRRKIIALTIAIIAVYESFLNILLPAFKIANSGVREMLSVPFQQTARYVKEHGEEVTEHEKSVIDNTLGYDTLAERYKPAHADHVKNKYNKNQSKEELKEYFGVWFEQFKKHPDTYVQATLNNTFGYLYIDCMANYVITGYTVDSCQDLKKGGIIDYKYTSDKLRPARQRTVDNIKLLQKIPIINLVFNTAFNSILVIGMAVYLFYKKGGKAVVVFMPMISTILVCMVSPVNAYFRYTIPYIFGMPLLISIFLDIIGKKGGEDR